MTRIVAFDYPSGPHQRRHGPEGYAVYESYREWLRDEFAFRCVFCLQREQWYVRLGSFHIDHFVPQAADPTLECKYDNLLYVCARCNFKKSNLTVPDPTRIDFSRCLQVRRDGVVEAIDGNSDGELLIELLCLDDPDCVRFRKMLLDTWTALQCHDLTTFVEWMRYPDDLPDLSRKTPPGNLRPDGVRNSWFARRDRKEPLGIY